jgi:AbrB family looped-hinge helix DNA binding protein
MTTATLTSKGQITVPQGVRRELGLQTGDKVDFVPDEDGGFRMVPVRKDVKELRGRFAGRVVKPASIEDMANAIDAEVAERRHVAAPVRARNAGGKR